MIGIFFFLVYFLFTLLDSFVEEKIRLFLEDICFVNLHHPKKKKIQKLLQVNIFKKLKTKFNKIKFTSNQKHSTIFQVVVPPWLLNHLLQISPSLSCSHLNYYLQFHSFSSWEGMPTLDHWHQVAFSP